MNMSFLSNIMAAQNANNAANDAKAAIATGQGNSLSALGSAYNTGVGAINSGATNSIGALNSGATNAQGFYDSALGKTTGALDSAFGRSNDALASGYGAANTAIQSGINANQPWLGSGQSANAMYGNALGLNGGAGNQAAVDAFQAGPGYDWQRNQATDAVARKMGSLGMTGSGNAMAAISDRAGQMANAEYGNWMNRLSGLSQQGQTAAANTQQGYNNLGNTATNYGAAVANNANNYGNNTANLYSNYGNSSANLASNLGNNIAGVYGNQGTALSTLAGNYGNNQANIYTNAANNTANTTMSGANLVNEALTSGSAALDAENNAARNRPYALVGGLMSGLGSIGAGMLGRGLTGGIAAK